MEAIIANLRQNFWIINIRAAVKRAKGRCQLCSNKNAKPEPPRMGLLPSCRTTPCAKAFAHTGMDYFGPIEVTNGRRCEKRWGALFTCMATRAVHLELADDLSTDSLLMCLKNLQNIRGRVYSLYSDRGTNMVGANNQLKQLEKETAEQGIEWFFIPPSSPHFGGVWERMVQEAKKLLNQKLWPVTKPKESVLRNAMIEIQHLLNCRPLTHIPLHVDDDEPLTPNHFLIGCAGGTYPSLNTVSKAEATRDQWRKAQMATSIFWERWTTEYLPKLMKREKWKENVTPLQKDDVVVFPDELRKGKFHKGRVEAVNTGADGQVRSALVQTEKTKVIKPAVKLAKLNVRRPVEEKFTGVIRPINMWASEELPDEPDEGAYSSAMNEWAKRQKIDVQKVKGLAEKFRKLQPLPKEPNRKQPKPHMWAKMLSAVDQVNEDE